MDTVPDQKVRGYFLALSAALLWGVSGTCAQYLFQEKGIQPEWLVTVRMLIAGVILVLLGYIKKGKSILDIWKNAGDARGLLLFGLTGMLSVQYTYFAAIKHSNAATATVLQYTGPVLIALYVAFKKWQLPTLQEIAALILAVLGTFLLVTHGNFQQLMISEKALFWGVLSAFALSIYTLQPISLLNKYDAASTIGWAMLIGGGCFSFIHAPWQLEGKLDTAAWLNIGFIIFFGTLIAFYAFLVSVKIIGGVHASLLACAEPLSAAFIALIWLNVQFGMMDWLGSLFIILTIFILAYNESKVNKTGL